MARRSVDSQYLLTPRQQEVLALLRLGLTNAQIAERLGISVKGAEFHVSGVIGRLGVRNRREAAHWPGRPPWWVGALAPVALAWRRGGAALSLKASSLATVASAGAYLAAMAGLAVIAVLLLLGDGDSGEPVAVARAPGTAGPPGAQVSLDAPGGATPDPSAPPTDRDPPTDAGRPLAPAAPVTPPPDRTPTPCPAAACAPPAVETPAPVPTPWGNGAMAVDCDAKTAGIQRKCAYASGERFWAQVHLVYPPAGGFDEVQARLSWMDEILNYQPSSDRAAELLWSGCAHADYQPHAIPSMLFFCVSAAPSVDAPVARGSLFQAEFLCRNDGATSIDLPVGADGTYLATRAFGWRPVDPIGVQATVTCGQCPAVTCSGPVDENGEMAVDCDAGVEGVQSVCSHPLGTTFRTRIVVTRAPRDGYGFWRALLFQTTAGTRVPPVFGLSGSSHEVSTVAAAVAEIDVLCAYTRISLVLQPRALDYWSGTAFLTGAADGVDPALRNAEVTCLAPTETPTPTPGP